MKIISYEACFYFCYDTRRRYNLDVDYYRAAANARRIVYQVWNTFTLLKLATLGYLSYATKSIFLSIHTTIIADLILFTNPRCLVPPERDFTLYMLTTPISHGDNTVIRSSFLQGRLAEMFTISVIKVWISANRCFNITMHYKWTIIILLRISRMYYDVIKML